MSGRVNSAIERAVMLPVALAALLAACVSAPDFHPSAVNIKTYKDIRGVTAEESVAVEAMASARDTFVYGHILEKESFRLPDDTFSGFTVDLFEFIGGLLGITFVPRYFEEISSLAESLDKGEIDIACGVSVAPGRNFVTAPIAGRRMNVYARIGADAASNMAGLGGHKVGFLKNTETLDVLYKHYSGLPFEPVEVTGFAEAARMIESNAIDFFIVDRDVTQFFERYADIRRQKFSSLVYTPITLAAVNGKLAPVVSIINRYLRAGGTAKIFELYENGETEYRKQLLYSSITSEERAYIDSVKANGGIVPVGFQHDAYPSCFYNHVEKKYQGIAPDILTEVTKLTGLSFEETVTTNHSSLADMLQALRGGELSMVTQVLYSKSREGDFIWSSNPYLSTRYALISRLDFPKVDNYRTYYHRIGLVDKSVHAEMFDLWFPNHEYKTFYATGNELFDALEKGEQCMAMVSENMLWAMTNFREKTGYKINVSFDYMQEARFGYNKNEVALRNIIDKVTEFVDVEEISGSWMNRTFDYSKKIARQGTLYAVAIAVTAVAAALVLVVVLRRNIRLRKTLLDESSKLSTIFSTIPDLAYCMDINMRYTSVNHAFERFAGKSIDDIIGKTNDYIFAGKKGMSDYFTEMNAKVLRDQKTLTVQEWAIASDGLKVFLEVIKTPLYRNGTLIGLIGIARDITAHKAAEARAIEASKVKSQFLANMSHEIRTPLNVVIGMSELLLMEQLSGHQRNYVKDISMSSHLLLSIINDILDFSRIEAGKLDLNLVSYDFRDLIANLTSMFRFMARKKNLAFVYEESEGGLPKCLYGDDMRLRQVLINLCANAINFTSSGSVSLKVTVASDMLTFDVKDTGAGIKPEELERIFSPFTNADSVKNRNAIGAGLGLAISKNFVDMMGGEIGVKSEYGKGSTFTVSIPKTLGDESRIEHAAKGGGGGHISFSAPDAKILVVDDNNFNLKVAFRLLGLYGIVADMASSGREAIVAVQITDYDIVFMDHMMPEMNGIQVTAKIRDLGGKFLRLPIIALTANATQGVQDIFLSSGLDDYISKPIELDKLSEILKKWIPIEKMAASLRENEAKIAETDAYCGAGNLWEEVGRIGGVNVEVAKNRMAGLEDMYRETLELFCNKTPKDCQALSEFLAAKDLQNFAILAHGTKSSLKTVGAMALSEAAYGLEKAGKAGDEEYCKEALPEFLERLEGLSAKLAGVCGFGAGEAKGGGKQGDRRELQGALNAALSAAEAYDGDRGIEAIERLLEHDHGGEMNGILKSVRTAFKNYDFDEAIRLLRRGVGVAG